MITLAEHDKRKSLLESHRNSNEPVLNGIACPDCGFELFDSNPMITLASHPAKKNINCGACGYKGYRLA